MKTILSFALALVWSTGILAQEVARENETIPLTDKSAAVPSNIDFQGRLHDSGGSPVNATLSITFSLYDVLSGGAALWTETKSVQIADGLFQVKLGEITPFTPAHFSGTDRWLGIKVGSEAEMTPRTKFSSVGYAMQASGTADMTWSGGGNTTDPIGRVGSVGVGTETPMAKLDVRGLNPDDGVTFSIGNSDRTHRLLFFGGREGDPNPFIQWKDGDPLRFSTDMGGWSEKMRITSEGNLGIGTTAPTALLHTEGTGTGEGNVLFVGHLKHYDNHEAPGNPPTQGIGTRLMWYPDKAAFRVGHVSDTYWNKDSIGLFSVAMGSDTKAKGENTTAMGWHTAALGDFSTSMGWSTKAIGEISFAIGSHTTASGHNSVAMGSRTIAASFNEVVFGSYNSTYTPQSTGSWNPSDRLFAIGNGVADGQRSNAVTLLKNGNLGIGADIPQYRLDIKAPGTGSTGIVVLRNSEGLRKVLLRQNANGSGSMFLYQANDTATVLITGQGTNYINSGNLGIGTTSPSNAKLQIEGSGTYEGIVRIINTGPEGASFFLGSTNSNWGSGGFNKNRFIMGHGSPSSANVDLTINSDGYVGIGTIQPISILHVKGSGWPDGHLIVQSETGNSAGIGLMNGLEGLWKISIDPATNGLNISNTADQDVIFVNQSRNVGIGTTSPASRLDVRGNVTIRDNSTGNIAVQLGTGLDYAEGFDVSEKDGIEPGTVLCIDPQNPGKLTISQKEYDTRVAGIVAGASGLGSGISLGAETHDFNVALAGRVYCWVDATDEKVEVGDLLTTSLNPGHAMKASDRNRVHGAILGKAMGSLEKGQKGLILVLVTLQ